MTHQDQNKTTPQTIRVWDMFVRLFHWGLVATITVALTTGFLMGSMWINSHVLVGSIAAALIIARIIWGFTGTQFARFSDFIKTPPHVWAYFREVKNQTAARHIGHNPLGGMMVVALVLVILGLAATGLVVFGGVLKSGPFAGLSYATGDLVKELHELGAIALILLIIAHVGGVVFESMRENENLTRSMINGHKDRRKGDAPLHYTGQTRSKPFLALAVFGMIAALIGGFVSQDTSTRIQNPPVLVDSYFQAYATECSDCHKAYHPSLLPAQSWTLLMSGLADHFGEDASLDAATVASINAWLQTVSADQTDTKPANVFRQVATDNPVSISKTPFWRKTHYEIAETTFENPPIYNQSNCFACHSDAETGWLYPANIKIPTAPQKESLN